MKKLILISVLVFAAFTGKAQYPAFDTFYVYHPDNCPKSYFDFEYNDIRNRYCYPYNIGFDPSKPSEATGWVIGQNTYGITKYAQHWHFDSTVYVCGMAIYHIGEGFGITAGYKGYILDSNLDSLGITNLYGHDMYQQQAIIDPFGYNMYFFGTAIPVQDFYLAADNGVMNTGNTSPRFYLASGGVSDTCIKHWYWNQQGYYDTLPNGLILCYFDDSPYFMKNGQWVRFADDSVYELYKYMRIDILPILMVLSDTIIITPPPEDSCRCENCGCDTCPPCCDTCDGALRQIDLDNSCKIYPNPAKNELFIQSDFKVITLEIYNNLGV
ncbi:MAG: T9SS type A sorting domain-containing protein, partial [Bacteroidales bacterium]|nr:T9SS type A sorting domain-containing protein [Bacteroidales bacterium]